MKRLITIALCSILLLTSMISITSASATDAPLSDEAMIQQTIHSLFIAKRNVIGSVGARSFDPSEYFTGPFEYNESLCYFTRYVWYMKGNYLDSKIIVLNPRVTLDYRKTEVSGDTAVVEVYEEFTYMGYSTEYGRAPCETSVGIPYTITLQKSEGRWLIDSISFYDEVTDSFKYPISQFSIPLSTVWTYKA